MPCAGLIHLGYVCPEFGLIGACYIQYFALAQFVRFFTTLPCAWSHKLVTFTVRIRLLIKLNPSTLQCVRLFACDVIGHFGERLTVRKLRKQILGRTWVCSLLFSASHLSCFRFRSCYDKSKQKNRFKIWKVYTKYSYTDKNARKDCKLYNQIKKLTLLFPHKRPKTEVKRPACKQL